MNDRISAEAKYGTGDLGQTLIGPGLRGSKGSLIVEVLGSADECNAQVGWVIYQLQKCSEYPCIYEEEKIREVVELLNDSINNAAATVYNRSELRFYIEKDNLTLDTLNRRIEEIRGLVGNAKEFIHVGYSGEMELILNDLRICLRKFERLLVRLYEEGKPNFQFLEKYLILFNRASLWAYWEARFAGSLYRSHLKSEGKTTTEEKYWNH